MLAEDFGLSTELQQSLAVEGDAHTGAVQQLRNQVRATPDRGVLRHRASNSSTDSLLTLHLLQTHAQDCCC